MFAFSQICAGAVFAYMCLSPAEVHRHLSDVVPSEAHYHGAPFACRVRRAR